MRNREYEITIAGRQFRVPFTTPEREEQMRISLKKVNAIAEDLQEQSLGKGYDEILAFTALNLGIEYADLELRLRRIEEEIRELEKKLNGYLGTIE